MNWAGSLLASTFGLVVYLVLMMAFAPIIDEYLGMMIAAGFAGYALAIAKLLDLSSILDIFSFFRP